MSRHVLLIEYLVRAGGCAAQCPGPPAPASRVADAIAARRPSAALDPGDLYGPGRQECGQARACPSEGAQRTSKILKREITTTEVSTVRGDCQVGAYNGSVALPPGARYASIKADGVWSIVRN
ncbi:hypothetical protein FHR32_000306 [Streptosporangium album]|uniref:Uncharacterized protein n=1 Tax=Streptosporangium album TaxID=47479 RepID=A0A7W7W6Q4_9ACTN|nr:hypothetical protein [Streptosporangium album]